MMIQPCSSMRTQLLGCACTPFSDVAATIACIGSHIFMVQYGYRHQTRLLYTQHCTVEYRTY